MGTRNYQPLYVSVKGTAYKPAFDCLQKTAPTILFKLMSKIGLGVLEVLV